MVFVGNGIGGEDAACRLRAGHRAVTGGQTGVAGRPRLVYGDLAGSHPTQAMDFRILGPLEVLEEGRAVTLGGSKQRGLLALLLLHANETLTTDRLIEELWGDRPPPTAAKNLQMHISRLRKALATGAGSDLVVTRERGYELELDPERLDANRFEALVAEARNELAAQHPERALTALEAALGLWHGEPLADLAYEPFAQGEIARLEDMHVGAIEQLIEAKLALGRHAEVINQLETLIASHPYRERLRGQLMLALYRCDRQADALQAYQDARGELVEELGIEPGERLRELERAILAQDPALAGPLGRHDNGEAAAPAAAPEELPTGVVTFLLTDIEGSSGLWEADPEGMAAALELHDELIARTVDASSGRLLKTKGEGDATVTVFRRASDAVTGAVALQEALSVASWPGGLELRVRIALHTGEAHERAGDYFGPALNRAARLRGLARGGATVVSQATAEIVHDRLPEEIELVDLGRHELRGLSRPENVFELRPVFAPAAQPPYVSLEMRKTVAVLFSSVVAAGPEGHPLDPEARRRLVSRYLVDMRAVLERHGGTVETYPGDALMAVFGVPLLHEDDALRAVRAAAEMHEELPALEEELERDFGVRLTVRVGVGAGEVIATLPAAGEPMATGEAVNVAKRLEELAEEGEVLIDEQTHGLVRGSVRTEPAGRRTSRSGESIAALRLLEVRPHTAVRASRLDSPLVNRERQLESLSTQFNAAASDRTCHLVTVLGSAGVGKSRLVEEFISGIGDRGSVLRGRCLPYGEGITYWPLAEVVSDLTEGHGPAEPSVPAIAAQLVGEPKADLIAAGVAEALGLGGSKGATSEKIFWAARRLLEAIARNRPLVVVFDDLQWAEPTFLDLVEHVTDLSRDAPIVVLCIARPDLLDARPGWGGGKLNATSILLEPLSEGETIELITNLLSRATLPPEAAARIAEATEGNPLFAEELLAMLIEDGLLRRADGGWTVADELADLPVPPTIHALLAARLEGLPDDERALLAHASVEGTVFHRAALDELAPASLAPFLERSLTSLVRRDMIRPERATVGEDEAYRFRHILIRDAAYRSLPKEVRAKLHERFAAWGARTAGLRLGEFEEILGYHLERAYRLLGELGTIDPDAEALAARAAEHLESAGQRALARSDHTGAVSLLERAAALLPDDHARRVRLLPDLGAALIEAGKLAEAEEVLAEASRAAAAAHDECDAARALVQQEFLRLARGESAGTAEGAAVVEQVVPVFEREGDDYGLCYALRLRAWLHWIEAQAEAAAGAWEQAAAYAHRAGAEHERTEILRWVALSLVLGPTPVTDGIRRCEAIQREASGNLAAVADVQQSLAGLHAMEGRFDRAHELLDNSNAVFEELGLTLTTVAGHDRAWVELLAGDPVAAELSLRAGYETLEEMGESTLLSTSAAYLAQALLAQGRDQEAERFAQLSDELATADDLLTQILWRGVRARTLAGRGHLEEAERLARQSVALAERTDFINHKGDALVNFAIVLMQTGEVEQARAAFAQGLRLYQRKGNTAAADKARAELAELAAI
jgi:class 3 adenylate cyclase/DNA-binding SARP family transcriptional activator